jgi:hypothetical protein
MKKTIISIIFLLTSGFSSYVMPAEGSGPDMSIYSTFAGYGFLAVVLLFFVFFFYFAIHHTEKPQAMKPVIMAVNTEGAITVNANILPAFNMAFYSVVLLATVQFLFIVLLIS